MTSRSLTVEEQSALNSGLDFAARIAWARRPLSLPDVQNLYDGFLEEEVEDADAIMALGLSFGQCLVGCGPFEWVRVIDEFGEETSVAAVGSAIYVHPISMIQKRLARRETVDIEQLCNDTLTQIGPKIASGDFSPR